MPARFTPSAVGLLPDDRGDAVEDRGVLSDSERLAELDHGEAEGLFPDGFVADDLNGA